MKMTPKYIAFKALEALAYVLLYLITACCLFCVLIQNSGCVDASGTYAFESEEGYWVEDPYVAPGNDLGFGQYESPFKLDLPHHGGCQQLDVLFVVDNSGSMGDDQERLLDAVPGFLDRLQEFGIGYDLHLGVTTTDEYHQNTLGCRSLGALVTATPVDVCGPYIEGAYMTRADELEFTFPCAFLVGTNGNGYEKPAEAMVEALKPPLSEATDPWGFRADECNVGFHRPEAALVIVLLTDEPDTSSAGTPTLWADGLYYLHSGEIFVVAFIPQLGCHLYLETEFSARLQEFLMQVPSYETSICAEDFALEFAAATEALVTQCAAVPPEG